MSQNPAHELSDHEASLRKQRGLALWGPAILYPSGVSAEAAEPKSTENERPSKERQDTVAFETAGPKSVPPPAADSTKPKAPQLAALPDAAPETVVTVPPRPEKKSKRQDTKPFVVVRDVPSGETDTGSVITAVGEIASEAREVAADAIGTTASAAKVVRDSVSSRMKDAKAELDLSLESEREEWKEAEDDADLPDVLGEQPLTDLAVRIDREADFWRQFAIRALRPGAPRNVAIASATLAIGFAVVLGIVGAFGAILGIESAGVDLVETAVALVGLFLAAVLMAAFVEGTRRGAAERALARAEVAERRLERVAAILELKKTDPARYAEALSRLERDPTR